MQKNLTIDLNRDYIIFTTIIWTLILSYVVLNIVKLGLNVRGCVQGYIIFFLTHWGRVTQICVVKLTIIGSDKACRQDGAKPLSKSMLGYC